MINSSLQKKKRQELLDKRNAQNDRIVKSIKAINGSRIRTTKKPAIKRPPIEHTNFDNSHILQRNKTYKIDPNDLPVYDYSEKKYLRKIKPELAEKRAKALGYKPGDFKYAYKPSNRTISNKEKEYIQEVRRKRQDNNYKDHTQQLIDSSEFNLALTDPDNKHNWLKANIAGKLNGSDKDSKYKRRAGQIRANWMKKARAISAESAEDYIDDLLDTMYEAYYYDLIDDDEYEAFVESVYEADDMDEIEDIEDVFESYID